MALTPRLKTIADSALFNGFITGLIIFSSIMVGVATYPGIWHRWRGPIEAIDAVVLACFVLELAIRIGAHGRTPLRYFRDPWNVFDFIVVVACLLPMQSQSVMVLRIVRLLRVLRLMRALPRLRMIIHGMIKSLDSLAYIGVLLFGYFYVFAIIGNTFFAEASPESFGRLHSSMLTLFQVITLENWPDVMNPVRAVHPVGGVAYFVLFILMGTMVIMNLFIGVIVGSMNEAVDEIKKDIETFRKQHRGKPRQGDDPLASPEERRRVLDEIEKLEEKLVELKGSVESISSRLRGEP